MLANPGSGSRLVDVPRPENFFGDSSIMVVDVGDLSGRQIATVWPGTSFVSKPGAEVVFS